MVKVTEALDKQRSLDIMTEILKRQFHNNVIKTGNEIPPLTSGVIRTGYKSLDRALGIGGIPCGKITEIYGEPGTGKTSLALTIAANAQKTGNVLYIDADNGLSPYLLNLNKVKAKNFYIARASTMEQAFDMCETSAAGLKLAVIDTLPSLPLRDEIFDEMCVNYDICIGRIIDRCIKRLIRTLSRSGCALLLVNQLRETRSLMRAETTAGGRALKHYKAVSISLNMRAGNPRTARITKNKCASPMQEAILEQ